MSQIKKINIKNRTYCIFDDMVNIKNFDPNQVKIDKKPQKNIIVYYIGYITIKQIKQMDSLKKAIEKNI